MKHNKRRIALILTLAILFSVMAITASAAITTAPPTQPSAICARCENRSFQYRYTMEEEPDSKTYATCEYYALTHVHHKGDTYLFIECTTCHQLLHAEYADKGELCTHSGKVWLQNKES